MQGRAFVFLNQVQALRFGHVGWGFQLADDAYYFGSTDHLYRHRWWDLPGWLRYAHVEPEGDNDWWEQTGDLNTMFQVMGRGHHIQYHLANVIAVRSCDPHGAIAVAREKRTGGWSVTNNNC